MMCRFWLCRIVGHKGIVWVPRPHDPTGRTITIGQVGDWMCSRSWRKVSS